MNTGSETITITGEDRAPQSACCSHDNTKKAKKFGKRCAICHTRVWKFWKARKCCDCKTVLHKSCVAASCSKDASASREASALVENPVQETGLQISETTEIVSTTAVERVGLGERTEIVVQIYRNPAPWTWANLTAVVVDCRRRPQILTVTVSHGLALTTEMFAELFEMSSPMTTNRRSRSSARPSTLAEVSADDIVTARPTGSRPQILAIEWKDGEHKAGDDGQAASGVNEGIGTRGQGDVKDV